MRSLKSISGFVRAGALAGATIFVLAAFSRVTHKATAAAHSGPMAVTQVTYSVANACSWSGANKCAGILPNKFKTDFTDAEKDALLQSALAALEVGRQGWRQGDCGEADLTIPCDGGSFMPYGTSVNNTSRQIDLTKLVNNRFILLGVMEPPPTADRRYRIAGDRGMKPKRRIFVVAHGATGYTSGTDSVWVASYTLFSSRGNGNVHNVGEGRIYFCGEKNETTGNSSNFLSCTHDKRLHEEAQRRGLRVSALLDASSCDLSLATGPRGTESCLQQTTRKVHALIGVANKDGLKVDEAGLVTFLNKLREDSSTDPYWFSCANGCCTAAM